tara:strand:+ start:415 stop:693 length:279 start_codon:yes stop_codon:yes gene_type:complete
MDSEQKQKIKKFFDQINDIDHNLMQLLISRFSIYSKIGELKINNELKTLESDYEKKILDKFSEEYYGALNQEQIKSIFSPIFRISDTAQKRR